MAAPAHLLLSALPKPVAEPSAEPVLPAPARPEPHAGPEPHAEPHLCAFSSEGACAEAPLTSEPPLPDAEPLTSEPPLAEAAPLTSESAADPAPSCMEL